MAKRATLVNDRSHRQRNLLRGRHRNESKARARPHAPRFSLAQSGSCAAHLALAARSCLPLARARGREHSGRRRRARAVRQSREGRRRRVGAHLDAARAATRRPSRTAASSPDATRVLAIEGFNQPQGAQWLAGQSARAHGPLADARRAHALSLRSRERRRRLSHATAIIRRFVATARTRDLVVERNQPADAARIAAVKEPCCFIANRRRRRSTSADARCASFRAAGTPTATSRSSSTIRASCSAAICSGTRCSRISSTRCRRSLSASVRALRRTRDTIYVPGHGALGQRRRVRSLRRDARRSRARRAKGLRGRNDGRGRRRGVHAAAVARRMGDVQQELFPARVRGVVQGIEGWVTRLE